MIGVYTNSTSERAVKITGEMISRLTERGVEYRVTDGKVGSDFSLILVIGGDGTVLNIISEAAVNGIPVLALNAGGTGFLTRYEESEIDECAEFIARGNYEFDIRPLISCEINGKTVLALNDITVQRVAGVNENTCTLSLSLTVGGEEVDAFRADGIIIATPTGSTAYSLSAGGAILSPSLKALIATPLCAHTLRSKPVVFSDSDEATIKLGGRVEGAIYADGRFVAKIGIGQSLAIKKAEIYAKLVKNKAKFYRTLQKKLTHWSEK